MEENYKTCIDNNDDPCDKCSKYGGDYYRDENGEIICRCLECPDSPYQDQENDTGKEKQDAEERNR